MHCSKVPCQLCCLPDPSKHSMSKLTETGRGSRACDVQAWTGSSCSLRKLHSPLGHPALCRQCLHPEQAAVLSSWLPASCRSNVA